MLVKNNVAYPIYRVTFILDYQHVSIHHKSVSSSSYICKFPHNQSFFSFTFSIHKQVHLHNNKIFCCTFTIFTYFVYFSITPCYMENIFTIMFIQVQLELSAFVQRKYIGISNFSTFILY